MAFISALWSSRNVLLSQLDDPAQNRYIIFGIFAMCPICGL